MEPDKLLSTMDAKVWTDEFMAAKARLGNKEFDHAMMLSWFANAIMAGFDEANRRAQRALDAEREKVKELEEQLRLANCDQVNTENDLNDVTSQLATLQAQLRRVEGERNTARHRVDALEAREIDVEILQGDLTTLRQLVEVHTKQLTELTIIPIGCSREQELRWTQSIKDLRATLAAQDVGKEDVGKEDVSHE